MCGSHCSQFWAGIPPLWFHLSCHTDHCSAFTAMMHCVFAEHQSSHCSYTALLTVYQPFQFTSNHTIEHKEAKKHNNTVEFHSIRRSRVTHPLCRDEFWSRSRVTAPSAKCKMHDTGAKSPLEVQKRQNFRNFSS
jgi:hypothetical protein